MVSGTSLFKDPGTEPAAPVQFFFSPLPAAALLLHPNLVSMLMGIKLDHFFQ